MKKEKELQKKLEAIKQDLLREENSLMFIYGSAQVAVLEWILEVIPN